MTNLTLTNKQQEIIVLLYRFRFLDRTHIQHFLNHKDKQQINKWLKDLTTKEYIDRFYDGSIIGRNRIPAIYSLKRNGIRLLKEQGKGEPKLLRKYYYEKNRTQAFISRCLLIARMCCLLDEKNSKTTLYTYFTQSDIANPHNQFHFLTELVSPVDLCFSKKQDDNTIHYYLVSLFDVTYPQYRIRKRIKEYYQFYFSNTWEDAESGAFPKILLLFSSLQALITAKRYTKKLLEQEDCSGFSIYFTLDDKVKLHGVTGEIWEGI